MTYLVEASGNQILSITKEIKKDKFINIIFPKDDLSSFQFTKEGEFLISIKVHVKNDDQ